MKPPSSGPIVARLGGFERAVEVGIGRRTDVAAGLASRGTRVTATDVVPRAVPAGVRFVRDDVTAPDRAVYADADLLYGLNLPGELHRPCLDLARANRAAFAFTTLGGEFPAIPVDPETLPGATLYWATPRDRPGASGEA